VNLSTLPPAPPILDALVNLLLDLGVDQTFDVGELNTTLFSAVKLLLEVLVTLVGTSLAGVDPLFGDGSESAPSMIAGKNLLSLCVNATPDRLQLHVVGKVVEVSANDGGNLLGLAERVSERDGETVLRDVSDSGASLRVAPDGPGRVDPTSVRSITVLGNQLRE
jgi:hypothetical protein